MAECCSIVVLTPAGLLQTGAHGSFNASGAVETELSNTAAGSGIDGKTKGAWIAAACCWAIADLTISTGWTEPGPTEAVVACAWWWWWWWREEDCIVRGLVNGWIVRHDDDNQDKKQYNYVAWARQQCLQADKQKVKFDSRNTFTDCVLNEITKSCNY